MEAALKTADQFFLALSKDREKAFQTGSCSQWRQPKSRAWHYRFWFFGGAQRSLKDQRLYRGAINKHRRQAADDDSFLTTGCPRRSGRAFTSLRHSVAHSVRRVPLSPPVASSAANRVHFKSAAPSSSCMVADAFRRHATQRSRCRNGLCIESAPMSFRPAAKKFISCMAMLAILMFSIAPVISQALTNQANGPWLQICSVSGLGLGPVNAISNKQKNPLPQGKQLFEHCPYCASHATFAPPPAPFEQPLLTVRAEALPLRFFTAPRTAHAWRTFQPRAPPVAA